jgi:hypothetical protein
MRELYKEKCEPLQWSWTLILVFNDTLSTARLDEVAITLSSWPTSSHKYLEVRYVWHSAVYYRNLSIFTTKLA